MRREVTSNFDYKFVKAISLPAFRLTKRYGSWVMCDDWRTSASMNSRCTDKDRTLGTSTALCNLRVDVGQAVTIAIR